MYIMPDMIDLGLEDEQKWPSDEHRVVAQNACLNRPSLDTRAQLTESVQVIIKIPVSEIKTVTYGELRKLYKVPCMQ